MSPLVRFTLFLALLCVQANLLAFDQFEPFTENGKVGLKNSETQEVVLPATYEAVGWSDNSFRIVDNSIGIKRNGKWALTKVGGDQTTPHQYTELFPFTNGLFVAGRRSQFSILNSYGVISVKGKTVIPLDYDRLTVAGKQLIAATLSQGRYKYGLLSNTGKWVIDQAYESITLVEPEVFAVKEPGKLSALFSDQGRQLSPFEFESIEAFDKNRLLVTYYNRKGLVNKVGKAIIPPVYKEITLKQGEVAALPFRQWNVFGNSTGKAALYFDDLEPLKPGIFAVQASENLGIITDQEAYIAYFENLRLLRVEYGLMVVTDGRYQGVIDSEGTIVMPLNYDNIALRPTLILGEIKRKNGQNWQVFDHKGRIQIREYYERFFEVTDERLGASRNGKLGLLDNTGIERSPFVYDSIGPFTEQGAVVKYQGNQGLINANGYWRITPYKDSLAIYPDYVLYRQGSEMGLIDYNESVLFRTQKHLKPITKGVLSVYDGNELRLTDERGFPLLEDPIDSVKQVHPDLLAVFQNEKCYLYRPSQRELIKTPARTQDVATYAEGAVAAKIDDQWGFISEQGQLRIANRYEAVQPFSEMLAVVKLIGKWGVINRQEKIIIQPTYDSIGQFYGGLAKVYKDRAYGLVDKAGSLVLQVQYDAITLYKDHIILESAGLMGLADRRGSIVRSPQYDRIEALGDGFFLLEKNGKQGVITLKGEDKVPLAYDEVLRIGNVFLAAEPSVWIKPSQ